VDSGVGVDVGAGAVSVGTAEGVKLGSVVAEVVGAGVATLHAVSGDMIRMTRMMLNPTTGLLVRRCIGTSRRNMAMDESRKKCFVLGGDHTIKKQPI
jgi:hypothetical protein